LKAAAKTAAAFYCVNNYCVDEPEEL